MICCFCSSTPPPPRRGLLPLQGLTKILRALAFAGHLAHPHQSVEVALCRECDTWKHGSIGRQINVFFSSATVPPAVPSEASSGEGGGRRKAAMAAKRERESSMEATAGSRKLQILLRPDDQSTRDLNAPPPLQINVTVTGSAGSGYPCTCDSSNITGRCFKDRRRPAADTRPSNRRVWMSCQADER